ncbi:hypothetical protein ACWD3P_24910 [Streptomyces sp. NPDC002765]|uniref:hypothetical protein n=1 Tax=Streptomyces sp. C1-1 TaxID=3231173 RepID=UPI003CFF37E8
MHSSATFLTEFGSIILALGLLGRLASGIEPSLGPLATAYVLILVVLGPLTARFTEPVATWLTARRRTAAAKPAAGTVERERKADQDTVARP